MSIALKKQKSRWIWGAMSFRSKITASLTLSLIVIISVQMTAMMDMQAKQFIADRQEEAQTLLTDFVKSLYGQWDPAQSPVTNRKAIASRDWPDRLANFPHVVYAVFQTNDKKIQYIPKRFSAYAWMAHHTHLDPGDDRRLRATSNSSRQFAVNPQDPVTEYLRQVRDRHGQVLGIARLGVAESALKTASMKRGKAALEGAALWLGLLLVVGLAAIHILAGRIESPLKKMAYRAERIFGETSLYQKPRDVLTLLQNEFETIEKKIRSLQKDRSQFVGSLSHEIRSPLQAIMGYADLMRKGTAGPITPEMESYLKTIKTSAARFGQTLDNLVDLARLDNQQTGIKIQPVDPKDVLSEAARSFDEWAHQINVQIEFDAMKEIMPVAADPTRLFQILVNLISNALKHSPPGGKVILGAREIDNTVELWVRDQGPGISAKEQEKVFEEFYQIKADGRINGSRGLGIGLTLSRILAQGQNGRITLDSVPGQGATARVILPKSTERIPVS